MSDDVRDAVRAARAQVGKAFPQAEPGMAAQAARRAIMAFLHHLHGAADGAHIDVVDDRGNEVQIWTGDWPALAEAVGRTVADVGNA